MTHVTFNEGVKLILADVDETIADVYCPAEPDMITELERLLTGGRVLFLVSGGGLQSIRERITDLIQPNLRQHIIIAHCSGAEVWGFQKNGNLNPEPYFGVYEGHFTEQQKKQWRAIIEQLVTRFHLKTFPTQPKEDFKKASGGNPLAIMLADRGPQITFEFVNSSDLTAVQVTSIEEELHIHIPLTSNTYDLRIPVMQEADRLYGMHRLPIMTRLGGTCALDHAIQGVDKTKAVQFVLQHPNILKTLGIVIQEPTHEVEIWGDKFSNNKGGPDFLMCLAVNSEVRALDFRKEKPEELPPRYNIQLWNGEKELHNGLLEYLQSR